jgi:hypothetical protein
MRIPQIGQVLVIVALVTINAQASELFPGTNRNVVGPPPAGSGEFADSGLRQQNEPSCAINPENPLRVCCGFNDYRGIDIPELGDAWEGIACSIDGGESWNSQLIPGHRADPLYSLDLEFAADPNLVSVPGGLVFNYIAANRDQVGGLFVQLYAWKNKEDGWPIEPVGGPRLVSKGTSGRFIDKPHAFGFGAENGETVTWSWENENGLQTRELPAGSLAISAAVFTGNENNDSTKINYWTSDDWGMTWNQPTKLTESKGINSGINIAANGDNVCAIWRRFDDNNESNAIFQACSTDAGGKFTRPKKIVDICPFDLVTLNGEEPTPGIVSLRSNTFPVIAGDGSRFYAFWTDRGYAFDSDGPDGCAMTKPLLDDNGDPVLDDVTGEPKEDFNESFGRIVYSVSSNGGKNWSGPEMVEDVVGADPSCPVANPNGFPGHQFMPAAYGAGQEVLLTWFDTRCDQVNQYRETVDPQVDKQMILDLWQDGVGLWRHSADIRAIKLANGAPVGGSEQVSKYPRAFLPGKGLVQAQYNFINARLFLQGTAPFVGDYLNVIATGYVLDSDGTWKNSNSVVQPGSPTFRVTWATNRDLFGNLWGEFGFGGSSSPYNPKNGAVADGAAQTIQDTGNSSVGVQDPPSGPLACTPTDTPEANPSNDRTRDQNVYTAAVYPKFTLDSPGAIKLSGIGVGGTEPLQRAIPVVVKNLGDTTETLQLTVVDQPSGGTASFSQFDPVAGQDLATTVTVKVWPRSSAVRTVFVTTMESTSSTALRVNSCLAGGASSCNDASAVAQVILNEDPLALEQPSFGGSSILAQETHDPTILNPNLLNAQLIKFLVFEAFYGIPVDGSLLNALKVAGLLPPDFTLEDVFNTALVDENLFGILLSNPRLLDPLTFEGTELEGLLTELLANPKLLNRNLLNPDALNPDVLNATLANPDLLNTALWDLVVANPDLLNPTVLNPDVLNALVANPDVLNPDLLNLIIANPDVLNPDVLNALVANQTIFATAVNALDPTLDPVNGPLTDPDGWVEILNVLVSNPNILNPDLLNSTVFNGLVDVSTDPGFPTDGDDASQLQFLQDNYAANQDLINAVIANPDILNPNILNPDILNPDILNPDILNPDILNPDILNPDILNPDILNPNILNPNILNPDVLNPDLLNPDILNPDLLNLLVLNPNILNPDILNPDILNPDVLNPDLLNPDLLNPDLLNALIENPNLLNPNILNPDILNPDVLNPDLLNATLDGYSSLENPDAEVPTEVDTGSGDYVNVTWQVQNTGNTTTGYMAQPTVAGADEDPDITGAQMIVSKPYLRQTTVNCEQVIETSNSVVVNVPATIATPILENPDPADSSTQEYASFWLSPGEIANVTIRVFGTSAEALRNARIAGRTGIYISSEACTTGVDQANCASRLPFALVERDFTPPTFGDLETFYEQFVEPFEANAPDGVVISYNVPPALDTGDGGSVPVSCDFAPGETFPLGISEHTCTATDSSGNQETIYFTTTVLDTTAPELTIDQDGTVLPVSVEQTSAAGAEYDFAEFSGWTFSAIDNVDESPTIACWVTDGSTTVPVPIGSDGKIDGSVTLSAGTWDLVCTATDDGPATSDGTTASGANTSAEQTVAQIVVVEDTTAPVVTVPAVTVIAEASSAGGATVTFDTSASDAVDSTLTVVCTPPSGSQFAIGDTEVSCSATDDDDNTGTSTFIVSVQDTTPPVVTYEVTYPEDASSFEASTVDIEGQAVAGAYATFDVTGTDFGEALTGDFLACTDATGSVASGDFFVLGATEVNCTVTDTNGQTTTVTFDVVVEDTTGPAIFVPSPGPVVEALDVTTPVSFIVTAVDAVDGNLTPICTPVSGSAFSVGVTAVNCTAADNAGNSSSAGFDVTVTDLTAPVVTVPDPITVEATSGGGANVDFSVTAEDLVDGDVTASVVCSVGGSPVSSGHEFGLGTTTVDCVASDNATPVNTSAPASFDITVEDTTPPTLSLPAEPVVAEASSAAGAEVDYSALVSASDVVDGAVAVSCDVPSGSTFVLGLTTVNCTATDAAANTSDSASFDVDVRDTTAPTLTVPAPIVVEATTLEGAPADFTPTATDAVDSSVAISCTPASGSIFPLGATVVTCDATDDYENTSSGSFTVTVQDTSSPVWQQAPPPIAEEAGAPDGNVVTYDVSGYVTDIFSVTVNCEPASGSLFPIATTAVTCTATDANGNQGTTGFSVTIADTTRPELSLPDDIQVDSFDGSGAVVDYIVSASDVASASVDVSCTPASGSTFDIGMTTVNCTATDAAGLQDTGSFTVTVGDVPIVWISPTLIDGFDYEDNIGPNLGLTWGYGTAGNLLDSRSFLARQQGNKGTDPLTMNYLGLTCQAGDDVAVDLDAGKSSLRYSGGEWQLNWQTGQSLLDTTGDGVGDSGLLTGCYELSIPRVSGTVDTRRFILQ